MAAKADYMLCLDSDHIFPDWALLRLLGLEQLVAASGYPMRTMPVSPTSFQGSATGKPTPVFTTKELADAKQLEQVRYIGLGFCLLDMKIINKLALQAAKEDRTSVFPLFDFTMTENPDVMTGEDAYFCDRLTAAEIPIFVDHYLSWHMKHIASLPISMADA